MTIQGLAGVDPTAQVQGASAVPDTTEKTDKAAHQFEGLLMGVLFQTMRKTVQPSGLFGDSGQSRSTYEYLLDQAVVDRAVSSGRGWGLAERLKESWAHAAATTQKKNSQEVEGSWQTADRTLSR
jgi:Rod binding domain-containing protein